MFRKSTITAKLSSSHSLTHLPLQGNSDANSRMRWKSVAAVARVGAGLKTGRCITVPRRPASTISVPVRAATTSWRACETLRGNKHCRHPSSRMAMVITACCSNTRQCRSMAAATVAGMEPAAVVAPERIHCDAIRIRI